MFQKESLKNFILFGSKIHLRILRTKEKLEREKER